MPQRNTTGHFLRPANAVTTGNVLEYDAVQIVGTCQLVGFKPSSLYDILGSILLQKTGFKNGLHPCLRHRKPLHPLPPPHPPPLCWMDQVTEGTEAIQAWMDLVLKNQRGPDFL
ncbi:hypothetical protein J3458_008695 [Metarhizium acridum]|uniref:uncharacterized protein n=1 Tax=Metarhizium acridum TaxID=92637 RepID=UPI001C6D0FDE|nr:hypothetical protein J3458_008695 [Metarhizium acridum]